jgi:hypothetical protein
LTSKLMENGRPHRMEKWHACSWWQHGNRTPLPTRSWPWVKQHLHWYHRKKPWSFIGCF